MSDVHDENEPSPTHSPSSSQYLISFRSPLPSQQQEEVSPQSYDQTYSLAHSNPQSELEGSVEFQHENEESWFGSGSDGSESLGTDGTDGYVHDSFPDLLQVVGQRRATRIHDTTSEADNDNSTEERPAYDISISTIHQYLGSRDIVERDVMFPVGKTIKLPVLAIYDVVVFPGSTLPLRLVRDADIDRICDLMLEGTHTIGVVCIDTDGSYEYIHESRVSEIGTIVDIRFVHNTSEGQENAHAYVQADEIRSGTTALTCVGRQRFRMATPVTSFFTTADVTVLANDIEHRARLAPRLCRDFSRAHSHRPNMHKHMHMKTRTNNVESKDAMHVGEDGGEKCVGDRDEIRIGHRFRAAGGQRFNSHYEELLTLPIWLYRFLEENFWIARVVTCAREVGYLSPSFETGRPDADPTEETFRLCNAIPSSSAFRAMLLTLDTSLERLCMLYDDLSQKQRVPMMKCRGCSVPIARLSEVFDMNSSGPVQAYVNPNGVVHDTITVRRVELPNVFLSGGAYTQDSWFPGYAWTILNCGQCGHHLGWRFTAASQLRPNIFWGLRRASVMFS
eukprot:CFRG0718T1